MVRNTAPPADHIKLLRVSAFHRDGVDCPLRSDSALIRAGAAAAPIRHRSPLNTSGCRVVALSIRTAVLEMNAPNRSRAKSVEVGWDGRVMRALCNLFLQGEYSGRRNRDR